MKYALQALNDWLAENGIWDSLKNLGTAIVGCFSWKGIKSLFVGVYVWLEENGFLAAFWGLCKKPFTIFNRRAIFAWGRSLRLRVCRTRLWHALVRAAGKARNFCGRDGRKRLINRLDGWFLRHGYWEATSRSLVRTHCLVALLLGTVGCALGLIWQPAFWFGVGALLTGWNFYTLSGIVSLFNPAGSKTLPTSRYALRFLTRLLLLGGVLAALFLLFKVSVIGLLAGLSTTLAIIPAWYGIRTFERKPKEA